MAKRLVDYGEIIGISRTLGASDELSKTGRFRHISYDLAEYACQKKYLTFIRQIYDYVDHDKCTLILNAANFYAGNNRLNHSDTAKIFSVNILSVMELVRSLEVLRLKRIFIVNSISGLVGQSEQHEYAASKHALMGFVRSLIKSAKNLEYDVMCINPGGMKTELWHSYSKVQTGDFLTPDSIADICLSLILFPQRAFVESLLILPPSDV